MPANLHSLPADIPFPIAELRAGCERAAERFVRENIAAMLSVAGRFFSCPHDQEDAVQDAFAAAFRAINSFNGTAQLRTWLHRITRNACLMKMRARAARPELRIDSLLPSFDGTGHREDALPADHPAVGERIESEEERRAVRRSIDRLPESYRLVLLLRDIEELSTQETAHLLECTTANVKTRLHRARQALRTLLEAEDSRRLEADLGRESISTRRARRGSAMPVAG